MTAAKRPKSQTGSGDLFEKFHTYSNKCRLTSLKKLQGKWLLRRAPLKHQEEVLSACVAEGTEPVIEEVQEHLARGLMHQFTAFKDQLDQRQVMHDNVIIEGMKQQVASMVEVRDRSQTEMALSLQELNRRHDRSGLHGANSADGFDGVAYFPNIAFEKGKLPPLRGGGASA